MIKKFLLITFLLFTQSVFAKKYCEDRKEKDIKICYLEYQLKYEKECKFTFVKLKEKKSSLKKDNYDLVSKEIYDINIERKRDPKQNNWFNLCFYPVQYYEMKCRKKVCGYHNMKNVKKILKKHRK